MAKIDRDKVMKVVTDSGLQLKEQSGFTKVMGPSGRNLYVAKGKTVGLVDISGFTVSPAADWGVTDLGGTGYGAVQQRLDFSLPEDAVLANLEKLLKHMPSMTDRAPEKKRQPGSVVARAPKPTKENSVAPTPIPETPETMDSAQKRQRLELIRRVAASKGVPVSDRALSVYGDDDIDEKVSTKDLL